MMIDVAWRSNTARCLLTNDNSSVELIKSTSGNSSVDEAGECREAAGALVCMSWSASVQSGHCISFHLTHTHAADAGDDDNELLLSDQDGVGLSLSDNVNIDTDDVIFYSFHGNELTHKVAVRR